MPSTEVVAKGPWFDIERVENAVAVSIYGEIGWEVTASEFIAMLDQVADTEDLTVHINSVGGQVFEGVAIYNRLLRHQGQVTVIIEGLAASMASVIAMAGNRVEMYEASLFMIHNPAGGAFGEADDFRKAAETLDTIREVLISAYLRRTSADKDQIIAWLNAETWFTPAEALEHGFIDHIIEEEVDIAACVRDFDLTSFAHAPQGLGKKTEAAASQPTAAPAAKATEKATMPNETSPAQPNSAASQGPAEGAQNVQDITADAIKAERTRVSEIRAMFKRHPGHEALMDTCVDEGIAPEAASRRLLDALGGDAEPTGSAVVVEDVRDKFMKGAQQAILIRAGLEKDDPSNEFRSFSMFDLARYSVESLHRRATGRLDRLAIVGEAFSHGTDDFDSLLANVATKAMLLGYEEQPEVYPSLVRIVSLTDFKQAKMVGLSGFSDLDEVGENGEYEHGSMSDVGENAQLTTFGKLFSITRHAIINDDLMAFTDIPRNMGRAARRKIGDLVADLLAGDGHTLDQDSLALFHADHANTGSAVPSTAAFEDMRTKMAKQTDPSGNAFINVAPHVLYVPYALWSSAQQVVESETEVAGSQNNSRRPNTARGITPGGVLPDARLDAEDAAAWYGLANPATHPSLVLGLLNGQDAPFLEEQDGFTRDGVTFKVRIDAVAEAVEFRHIYRGNNT